MSDERRWKLGEDMGTHDSILDGLTFDDLILALHCNVPANKISPEDVWRELECNILPGRLEDMRFLVENNMDKIIAYARDYYRDE